MSFLAAFTGALMVTALLSHVALSVGWIDQLGDQAYRKLREQPVALVGGAAILLGVLLAVALSSAGAREPWASFSQMVGTIAWPGLLGAFVLGLLDDVVREGLSARVKFAGQLLVAALVAWYPGSLFAEASALECLGLGLLALVAMNAVNLFDHADGLSGLLCAIAMLAGSGPLAKLFAAGAAGYLPFNLFIRHSERKEPADVGEEGRRSAPYAMLGDSGSHVVGVLLATTPGAWWFLALPILDMLRVALGRARASRPFWRGDRTHMGHLLEDLGFSPVTVAMLVATAIAPPLVTIGLMDGLAPLFAGLLASAALYFGMLVMADGAMPAGSLLPDGGTAAPGLDPDRGSRATGVGSEGPGLRVLGPSVALDSAGLDGSSGPFAEPLRSPSTGTSEPGTQENVSRG